MGKIKTIGILTSGGDSPGMNAAIRALTRAGIYNGFRMMGIYRGYDGLIKDEIKEFTTEDVSGIKGRHRCSCCYWWQRFSDRCLEFRYRI